MNLNQNCRISFQHGIIHRKEKPMTPGEFSQLQIELYRQMTGEERLLIALNLHEMSCEIARDGIRGRYPNASPEEVEIKLHERLRQRGQNKRT